MCVCVFFIGFFLFACMLVCVLDNSVSLCPSSSLFSPVYSYLCVYQSNPKLLSESYFFIINFLFSVCLSIPIYLSICIFLIYLSLSHHTFPNLCTSLQITRKSCHSLHFPVVHIIFHHVMLFHPPPLFLPPLVFSLTCRCAHLSPK